MSKMNTIVVGTLLVLVGFFFYWLGVRPGQITKKCWIQASEKERAMIDSTVRAQMNGIDATVVNSEKLKDDEFKSCLFSHGIHR